jgi:site-specific recombinase XerD
VTGDRAKRLHSALRSFFRALKRERVIFRDPAELRDEQILIGKLPSVLLTRL